MKIDQVLKLPDVASGNLWIRPVGYPKRYAWCVQTGLLYLVPTATGGELGFTPNVSLLVSEWEAVTVDDVLGQP